MTQEKSVSFNPPHIRSPPFPSSVWRGFYFIIRMEMNDIKPKLINLVAALSVTQSISKTIAEALFVLIDKWNIGEYLSTLELTTKLLHAITPTSSETSISERPDA